MNQPSEPTMLGRVASLLIKSRGLRRSLKKVREEIGVARKHRRGAGLAKRHRSARGLKVNVGCGPNPKIGWLNIDLSDTADVTLDLREPIPVPDGSCVIIYSEHFFEHLDYPGDAMRFLSECHRLLEAGGKFSGSRAFAGANLIPRWTHRAARDGELELAPRPADHLVFRG
jgi:SAM-dependent methyltransferase